jgi:hypothetical protein
VTQGRDEHRSKIDPLRLADAALDGDLRFEDALGRSGRGASRAAAHVRSIRRLERVLRLEKNSVGVRSAPDLTGRVLGAVDERRGWLDGRSRRLVWGGRVLAAAALLGAIGLTLAVRRAAPDLLTPSSTEQALASVVSSGERAATRASEPAARVVEALDGRTPVIVRVTSTLCAEPEVAWRLSGGVGNGLNDNSASIRASMVSVVRYERSTAPGSLGRDESLVVVDAPLCPLSQHAVEVAAGFDRTPRLFRSMASPSAAFGSGEGEGFGFASFGGVRNVAGLEK